MILNAKKFWKWWTTELRSWMTERFRSVISNIPTVEQIQDGLAKEQQATLNRQEITTTISNLRGGTATVEQVKTIVSALTNGLTQADKDWLTEQFKGIDLSSITDKLDNSEYGLEALKQAIASIPTPVIPTDYAKEATLTAESQAIKNKIDAIDIDTSTLATLQNQRKMMVNFGMSEGEPQLVAMTDTEILNQYDGYEDEGTHIEGIADTTYGHLAPADVTIDDEPFTFYQERTYADYGYSTLYDSEGEPYAVTNHPQEGDELYTTND